MHKHWKNRCYKRIEAKIKVVVVYWLHNFKWHDKKETRNWLPNAMNNFLFFIFEIIIGLQDFLLPFLPPKSSHTPYPALLSINSPFPLIAILCIYDAHIFPKYNKFNLYNSVCIFSGLNGASKVIMGVECYSVYILL